MKFWKTEKKPTDIILHLCSTNDNHMMHGSWDTECNKQIFLSFWAIFYLLNLLINRKIKIMKNEKMPEDIIILHLCTINYDHMMYGSWNMEHNRHFFIILDQFLPFYHPNNPENLNFEKMKKTPGDIIILHKSTITDNHMMYDSWDMKHSRQNLLFWAIFCPFTFLTIGKIKILKKKKEMPGENIILHRYTKNHDHMLHFSWDMVSDWCNFSFSFWAIFCPFTPNSLKNYFKKIMKKTPGDIIILHMCTKN